jgi:hypothetical protein
LNGRTLGPLTLGLTRAQARHRLPHSKLIGYGFENFCLNGGAGIRVGYPSPRQLRALTRRQQARVRGRIVIALTANPYYKMHGFEPGGRVAPVARKLRLKRALHIGLNYWYVVPGKRANGVLKVRDGIIDEVGIVDKWLTRERTAQDRLLTGFDR